MCSGARAAEVEVSNPLAVAADRRASRLALRASGSTYGGGSSGFAGAMNNRLLSDWILAGTQSADQEVRGSLVTLKQRSRELGRNNPHASRYLQLKADNVIGDEGITLQARVRDAGGRLLDEVNRRIEEAWLEWCEVGNCTVDGRWSWHDVERMSVVEEARDGDLFVRLVPAWRANRFAFALQLIDSDQVDVEYSVPGGADPRGNPSNEIRMSVEIDAWGREVAFHVWASHPNEPEGRLREDRQRIPAEQMVHWYRPYRAGQTRGIPDFAPVLVAQKMLAGYEEAELVASRIAAAKGGFFERASDEIDVNQMMGGGGSDTKRFSMEVEPGLFESLPPGWKFNAWDPVHPTNAFPAFHKAILRTISTGLGVSYNQLSQDWESTSFSSSRMDERTSRPAYQSVQKALYRHLHQRVYREWLLWSLTTGALDLDVSGNPFPTRAPEFYHRVSWQPRGWEGVDRVKDADADEMEVHLGLNSRTRICAAHGRNYEDVLDELAREQALAEQRGVWVGGAGGTERIAGEAPEEEEGEAPEEQDEAQGRLAARVNRVAPHLNGASHHGR